MTHYSDVFGDVLADHHESPRNYGNMEYASSVEEGYNPVCGDKVKIYIKWDSKSDPSRADAKLEDLKYEGEGCSICMASASIMTEKLHGLKKEELLKWIEGFRAKMQGNPEVGPLPEDQAQDDIVALYGVKRFPVRIKCALLPWTTLKKAIEGSSH